MRAILSVGLVAGTGAASADSWSPTGSLITARYLHSALLLPNGKVMVISGDTDPFLPNANNGLLGSVELYNPSTGFWSAAASLNVPRQDFTATLLNNGKVLVAGGSNLLTNLRTAELYDPAKDVWSFAGSMNLPRAGHTATLLADGRVLVVAGAGVVPVNPLVPPYVQCQGDTEIYDPSTDIWTAGGCLGTPISKFTATLLPNGKVLIAGGVSVVTVLGPGPPGPDSTTGPAVVANAELYDPATNTWTTAASMSAPRYGATANLLANGKVLVAAGQNDPGLFTGLSNPSSLATAELYDPVTNTWSAAASLSLARYDHTATLLPDGKLMVTGGIASTPPYAPPYAGSGYVVSGPAFSSVKIYEPATDRWSEGASLTTPRFEHTATLLANGQVLVTGGITITPSTVPPAATLASTELYTPSSVVLPVVFPQTGIWWNPAEGGRGFNIEFNGAKIYLEAYMYDASGNSVWYVAGPAPMNGSTFTAPLSLYANGQTLTSAWRAPSALPSPGNISIAFSDPGHGSVTWPGGTMPIQRYEYVANGLNSPPTELQPQNGWWWNPAEGGRGFFLETQAGSMYPSASMYDASGNAAWYVSGPAALSGNAYVGNWTSYTGGQILTGTYKSPTGSSNNGSLTIQFASPSAGTLTLPNGHQIAIQRYSF